MSLHFDIVIGHESMSRGPGRAYRAMEGRCDVVVSLDSKFGHMRPLCRTPAITIFKYRASPPSAPRSNPRLGHVGYFTSAPLVQKNSVPHSNSLGLVSSADCDRRCLQLHPWQVSPAILANIEEKGKNNAAQQTNVRNHCI